MNIKKSNNIAINFIASVLLVFVNLVCAEQRDGIIRFDFETGDLQGWVVVEEGFGKLVSDRQSSYQNQLIKSELGKYNLTFSNTMEQIQLTGNEPVKNKPASKSGKYHLSSFDTLDNTPSDGLTGMAESPVFELLGPKMTFLIAGCDQPETYVALCTLDEKEVLKAHGKTFVNTLAPVEWSAPELVGQKVFLRFVDRGYYSYQHLFFDDFQAQGRFDDEATTKRFGIDLLRKKIQRRFEQINLMPLGKAIDDLAKTFGKKYPNSNELLTKTSFYQKQLDTLRNQIATGNKQTLKKTAKAIDKILEFQFKVLVANPLVSGNPILFTVRNQYYWGHHNTETLFQNGQPNEKRQGFGCVTSKFQGGGALRSIDFGNGGKTETLIDLPEGIVRDPEVNFDGTKVVFSMRKKSGDDYHIYQINTDGTGLKQLTFASEVSDFDPLYLSDGRIAFSSTREPKRCGCNIHIMANIYRMDSDGANIHQITKNALFDGQGSLMPDGRILYNRWEYVDRNFGDAQGLWTVNPDGTNQAVYWGNNTSSPGSVLDARIIPGTQKCISTFSSCHSRPWGAIAIIDRQLAIDGEKAVEHIWPKSTRKILSAKSGFEFDPYKGAHWADGPMVYFDTLMHDVKLKYEDPYPLNDKYFLCSKMIGRNEQMGIYLIDVFGNEILLHTEEPGCYDPMPLRPQSRPLSVPDRRDFENKTGRLYVLNVYEGTHIKGVKPGDVKYLRVVEAPEKRFYTNGGWGGQGAQIPTMNWHNFENKRILGTVPVEEDGSAYFEVPSDKFIFFQLLDKNKMMIQTMRSGTVVQSGETTGCIGCHEDRRNAPKNTMQAVPIAMKREPSKLNGWQGQTKLFNYLEQVQPVLDRNCVRCHDYDKEAGEKLNLAGDLDFVFNTSYTELWRKGYIKAIGAGTSHIQQPYTWGSHKSKIIDMIKNEHNDVKLSTEEFERIVTWIDLNGPYYPYFSSAYPNSVSGRSPLSETQLARLRELTGVNFARSHSNHPGVEICFNRPELSPCLDKFSDKNAPEYLEALAIIQAGKEKLAKTPRADMPDYTPSQWHKEVLLEYDRRLDIELENRCAIRNGQKLYDEKTQ